MVSSAKEQPNDNDGGNIVEFVEYLGCAELASKGVISDWILAGVGMHEREMQSFGVGGREVHGQASLEDNRVYSSPFLYYIGAYNYITLLLSLWCCYGRAFYHKLHPWMLLFQCSQIDHVLRRMLLINAAVGGGVIVFICGPALWFSRA